MARRLLNLLTALSLLLCVAVCVLWVRSYWPTDEVAYRVGGRVWLVRSYHGTLRYFVSRFSDAKAGWGRAAGGRYPENTRFAEWADESMELPHFAAVALTAALPVWWWAIPRLRRNGAGGTRGPRDDAARAAAAASAVGLCVVGGLTLARKGVHHAADMAAFVALAGGTAVVVLGVRDVVGVVRSSPRPWPWDFRMRKRIRLGLCPDCGYDLRATLGRCPECGRITAPQPAT